MLTSFFPGWINFEFEFEFQLSPRFPVRTVKKIFLQARSVVWSGLTFEARQRRAVQVCAEAASDCYKGCGLMQFTCATKNIHSAIFTVPM